MGKKGTFRGEVLEQRIESEVATESAPILDEEEGELDEPISLRNHQKGGEGVG